MKFRIVLLVVFVLCIVPMLVCCDARGALTQTETNELYVEIKQDCEKGSLWKLNSHFEQSDYSTDSEQNSDFFRSAIDTVFHREEAQTKLTGRWFDSKKKCKIIIIEYGIPFNYNGVEYIIDSLYVQKYYHQTGNNHYRMNLHYHDRSSDKAQYISIVLNDS